MSDFNSTHNRIVWCDIPVVDLDRAAAFYKAVLNIEVHKEKHEEMEFCVLDHKEGNGGCLVVDPQGVNSHGAFLVYFNVDKRIQNAVQEVENNGGKVIQPIHSIGPYGCRAVITDSEGNKLALHSTVDA